MKLYDKDFKFVKTVDEPSNKFHGVKAFNEDGMFIKAQFSKSGKLVRSYVGVEIKQI